MRKNFTLSNLLIISVVAIGSFLRFFNPLWDNGLFLHPDERLFINASDLSLPISLGQFFSPTSPLNPHMFYYGSLLLYIYKVVSLFSPFPLLMTSRMISAFFSSLTIGVIFGIGKQLFSKRVGVLSSIVFAFSVGSIQYAHFNTTESSLVFLIALITYVDILTVKKKNPYFLVASLTAVGIATSIKVTGLVFAISPLIASLLLVKERIAWKTVVFWLFFGGITSGILFFLCAPYQLIDLSEFLTQTSYMQDVTYGIFKPPFVIIYNNTPAYIYQLFHIFPFTFGFVSFPLSLIGLFLLIRFSAKQWKMHFLFVFLFAFPLLYFAWSGIWFAKFARYYLILFPFLSVWAGYFLSKLKASLVVIFLFLICLNGLLFMRIYVSPNTRIQVSEWIYAHIPYGSAIATEHWDDALPLILPEKPIQASYVMHTLTVYDAETPTKIFDLSLTVSSSDYIILSSRRVYASILDNKNLYPETSNFYKKLFAEKLGFRKVYEKTNFPFYFSDNFADETFQSYDHPPVVIFKNEDHFSQSQILTQITSQ